MGQAIAQGYAGVGGRVRHGAELMKPRKNSTRTNQTHTHKKNTHISNHTSYFSSPRPSTHTYAEAHKRTTHANTCTQAHSTPTHVHRHKNTSTNTSNRHRHRHRHNKRTHMRVRSHENAQSNHKDVPTRTRLLKQPDIHSRSREGTEIVAQHAWVTRAIISCEAFSGTAQLKPNAHTNIIHDTTKTQHLSGVKITSGRPQAADAAMSATCLGEGRVLHSWKS